MNDDARTEAQQPLGAPNGAGTHERPRLGPLSKASPRCDPSELIGRLIPGHLVRDRWADERFYSERVIELKTVEI
jgi:hypothetical protein